MANITSTNFVNYLNKNVASHSKTMYAQGGFPSVQAFYGTYDSKETAHKTLCAAFGDFPNFSTITGNTPCTDIPKGFTVGVEIDGIVTEFQYKGSMPSDGYTVNDLVIKSTTGERKASDDEMGYIVLDKGKSFTEQVVSNNTIYEIRSDFAFDEITFPENCKLFFNGGSLKNGTMHGRITFVGNPKLTNVTPDCIINDGFINLGWFEAEDYATVIQPIFDRCLDKGVNGASVCDFKCYVPKGTYNLSSVTFWMKPNVKDINVVEFYGDGVYSIINITGDGIFVNTRCFIERLKFTGAPNYAITFGKKQDDVPRAYCTAGTILRMCEFRGNRGCLNSGDWNIDLTIENNSFKGNNVENLTENSSDPYALVKLGGANSTTVYFRRNYFSNNAMTTTDGARTGVCLRGAIIAGLYIENNIFESSSQAIRIASAGHKCFITHNYLEYITYSSAIYINTYVNDCEITNNSFLYMQHAHPFIIFRGLRCTCTGNVFGGFNNGMPTDVINPYFDYKNANLSDIVFEDNNVSIDALSANPEYVNNLIEDSAFSQEQTIKATSDKWIVSNIDKGYIGNAVRIQAEQNISDSATLYLNIKNSILTKGKFYTISFYAKFNEESEIEKKTTGVVATLTGNYGLGGCNIDITDTWKRYYFVVKTEDDRNFANGLLRIGRRTYQTGAFDMLVSNIQIEEGAHKPCDFVNTSTIEAFRSAIKYIYDRNKTFVAVSMNKGIGWYKYARIKKIPSKQISISYLLYVDSLYVTQPSSGSIHAVTFGNYGLKVTCLTNGGGTIADQYGKIRVREEGDYWYFEIYHKRDANDSAYIRLVNDFADTTDDAFVIEPCMAKEPDTTDSNVAEANLFFVDGHYINAKKYGTFAEKPTDEQIQKGYQYFCTNRQVEGSTKGIMLYYAGDDIWVNALGVEIK